MPRNANDEPGYSLEAQYEQIFDDNLAYLGEILKAGNQRLKTIFQANPNIIRYARQRNVNSGRLDLLLLVGQKFLLIELKAYTGLQKDINQVTNYCADLRNEQTIQTSDMHQYSGHEIIPILLAPNFSSGIQNHCPKRQACILGGNCQNDVMLVAFKEADLIATFFESKESVFARAFYRVKPVQGLFTGPFQSGIWINKLIYLYENNMKPKNEQEIWNLWNQKYGTPTTQTNQNLPVTIQKHIRQCLGYELIFKDREGYYHITKEGEKYLNKKEIGDLKTISEGQLACLIEKIIQNPFNEKAFYAICVYCECIAELMKKVVYDKTNGTFSGYGVSDSELPEYFKQKTGVQNEWDTSPAQGKKKSSNYFLDKLKRYCRQLRLISRRKNLTFLTPWGFNVVIQFQLRKVAALSFENDMAFSSEK